MTLRSKFTRSPILMLVSETGRSTISWSGSLPKQHDKTKASSLERAKSWAIKKAVSVYSIRIYQCLAKYFNNINTSQDSISRRAPLNRYTTDKKIYRNVCSWWERTTRVPRGKSLWVEWRTKLNTSISRIRIKPGPHCLEASLTTLTLSF